MLGQTNPCRLTNVTASVRAEAESEVGVAVKVSLDKASRCFQSMNSGGEGVVVGDGKEVVGVGTVSLSFPLSFRLRSSFFGTLGGLPFHALGCTLKCTTATPSAPEITLKSSSSPKHRPLQITLCPEISGDPGQVWDIACLRDNIFDGGRDTLNEYPYAGSSTRIWMWSVGALSSDAIAVVVVSSTVVELGHPTNHDTSVSNVVSDPDGPYFRYFSESGLAHK